AIHLHEKLIEGLLPLVVSAAEAGAAVPSHCVDLVDEDDAGRVRLALLEEIANAARADADEHLHEVRPGHREEWPARLTRHGLREKGLGGTRGPDEQGAFGQPSAEASELLGILQELDDLLQLDFGLVSASDVSERDLGCVSRQELGLGLSESEGPAAPR